MKNFEMILGYAEYNDEKYPFVYENGILNLLPGSQNEWEKQKSNLLDMFTQLSELKGNLRWIDNKYIYGITNENKNILFITNGTGSNNNGFIKYEVQVIYEYQLDSPNEDLIGGLIIKADEIDYFFDPARVFESEIDFSDDNKINSILVRSNKDSNFTKDCGIYNIGDTSVNIEVSAYSTYSSKSEKPLSAKSQICFEFNKAVNIDKALEVIYQQESFLRYICYRKNIKIRSIDVIRRNENNLRSKEGKISIINSYIDETNKKKSNQILTFELLEENISSIFQSIADGEVYLNHLCNSIDSKNSYNIARVILLFAAFEGEYKNFFSSKPVRSEKYFDVKEDVLDLINKFREKGLSSKSKNYVDSFIMAINYNDNILSSCIKNVIEKNLEIIKIFLIKDYKDYDKKLINEIAQRLSSMRNHIAHGNLDLKIEPINILDLKILESLIYIMRLSSLKISNESIQKGICKLIGYNIAISASK